jgi:hypothetical protein
VSGELYHYANALMTMVDASENLLRSILKQSITSPVRCRYVGLLGWWQYWSADMGALRELLLLLRIHALFPCPIPVFASWPNST